jgi:hypothetical protein
MATEDALLFHATLSLAAHDLAVLKGEDEITRMKLLFLQECISLLRQRLDDPELGVSDVTIAAVLILAIVVSHPAWTLINTLTPLLSSSKREI